MRSATFYIVACVASAQPYSAPDYVVSTLAGGVAGALDGTGTGAQFNGVLGLAYASDYIYVAESNNDQVRMISATTLISSTVAGQDGFPGYTNAVGTNSKFNNPHGLDVDTASASAPRIFVSDQGNNVIREIALSSLVVRSIAGGGSSGGTAPGHANGVGSSATFTTPYGVTYNSPTDTLYVLETNMVRAIIVSTLQVTTVAGTGVAGTTNGYGTNALLGSPRYMSIDPAKNFALFGDNTYHNIRGLFLSTNQVTTLVPTASTTAGTANGDSVTARLNTYQGGAFDTASGLLYFTDWDGNNVRMVNMSNNDVSAVAGSVTAASGLAQGWGTNALFKNPCGIAFDSARSLLYVADYFNSVVRKISFRCPAGTYASASKCVICPPDYCCPPGTVTPIIGRGCPVKIPFTGSDDSYVVAPTCILIQVQAWGGGGAGAQTPSCDGGEGAYIVSNVTVASESVLTVIVGGGGVWASAASSAAIKAAASSSTYGGGGAALGYAKSTRGGGSGGGRSAVQITVGVDVVTAAGGGSAGAFTTPAVGGDGGTPTGGDGAATTAGYQGLGATVTAGGGGGTAAIGNVNFPDGNAGIQYRGGDAALNCDGCGAGGGGYYGGGSSCTYSSGSGGGGGGSSGACLAGGTAGLCSGTSMSLKSASTKAQNYPGVGYSDGGLGSAVSPGSGGNGLVVITCVDFSCLAGTYKAGVRRCLSCTVGHYCLNACTTPTPCPSGTYGDILGLSTSSCAGLCAAGFYGSSTANTNSSCNGPCTAIGYYCPPGSTGVTQYACPAGTYGASAPLATNACTGLCNGGRWGAAGQTTSLCSGQCTAGYYCPAGSTSPTEMICGIGKYCPAGASTPAICQAGYYGSITTNTVSSCNGACNVLGFYCPAGSNSSSFYACAKGFFGSTGYQATSSCSGPCAAGSYGASVAMTSPSCSGPCSAGFYGSSMGNQLSSCDVRYIYAHLP